MYLTRQGADLWVSFISSNDGMERFFIICSVISKIRDISAPTLSTVNPQEDNRGEATTHATKAKRTTTISSKQRDNTVSIRMDTITPAQTYPHASIYIHDYTHTCIPTLHLIHVTLVPTHGWSCCCGMVAWCCLALVSRSFNNKRLSRAKSRFHLWYCSKGQCKHFTNMTAAIRSNQSTWPSSTTTTMEQIAESTTTTTPVFVIETKRSTNGCSHDNRVVLPNKFKITKITNAIRRSMNHH